MKSIFEEMGGTYRQVGDYFIPNLALPDTGKYQIGKYGRMRRSYLKEYRKTLYNNYGKRQIKNTGTGMICTPFTGHPVEGVLLCGTHMSTKGNV